MGLVLNFQIIMLLSPLTEPLGKLDCTQFLAIQAPGSVLLVTSCSPQWGQGWRWAVTWGTLQILYLWQKVGKAGLVLLCSPQGLCFWLQCSVCKRAAWAVSHPAGPQRCFGWSPAPQGLCPRAASRTAGHRARLWRGRGCCWWDQSSCGFNYWGFVV